MKVNDLVSQHGFKLLNEVDSNKEISGLHCCDLLSWVMANGKEDNAWITVMTHNNIVAVASLLDMACIIIPSDIEVTPPVLEKAASEDIAILSTPLDAYGIFKVYYEAEQ